MCGIAGILGDVSPDDTRRVAAMVGIQRHRGPDANRVATLPGAILGHARLSIIDLTTRASQPMLSADGRHAIVFNGEIYNFLELKAELSRAYDFTTHSDTEVLLAAWQQWGASALDRLRGMFAFCILDTATRNAFLARDRFGQKPLYYTGEQQRLLFSSEIKALLAAGVRAKPDQDVWTRYLATSSYDDDAHTFFDGILQLEPGTSGWWQPGRGLRTARWYDLAARLTRGPADAREAASAVRDAMIESCTLHMRSDVPVGVSLSGGLDSTALLACLEAASELNDRVTCFSVEFGGPEPRSERPWVEAACRHHNLPLIMDSFEPSACRESIRTLIWHSEGPLGGIMNCARAHVMARARSEGVIVLQDGSGLDEAFAGYRLHHDLHVGQLLTARHPAADVAIAEYAAAWGVTPMQAREASLAALDGTFRAIDGTVPARPDLLTEARQRAAASPPPRAAATGDPFHDALIDFLTVRKIPRNLRMMDRMSMASATELRAPFLDHTLVELGLSLPADHYFRGGLSKSIIREALAGMTDDSVRLAPKRSVHAPQERWLRSEPIRGYIRDLITSERFADRGFLDARRVIAAFEHFCLRGSANSFFVWQWINLEEWFRTFIDQDAATTTLPLRQEFAPEPSAA